MSRKHLFVLAIKTGAYATTNGRRFDKKNRLDAPTGTHQRLHIIRQQCEDTGKQIFQTHAEEKSVS